MTCLTTGTFVTTLKGEIAIEDLEVGDRVVTRDNGLQTVRRISRRTFDFGQLSQVPHLHPILVSTGSLGKGLPENDMLVSPNLRILETGAAASALGAGKDSLK
ncbi:MAG: Hint domain-containing protein, partial [Paracoccaceae bacterium]